MSILQPEEEPFKEILAEKIVFLKKKSVIFKDSANFAKRKKSYLFEP
jgi:hypothetical protein